MPLRILRMEQTVIGTFRLPSVRCRQALEWCSSELECNLRHRPNCAPSHKKHRPHYSYRHDMRTHMSQ